MKQAAIGFIAVIALALLGYAAYGYLNPGPFDQYVLSDGSDLTSSEFVTTEMDGETPVLVAHHRAIIMGNRYEVDPANHYRISATVRSEAEPAMFLLGVQTYDENGKELTSGPGTYRYANPSGTIVEPSDGWVTITGEITGEGDTEHSEFRPGTRKVRVVLVANHKATPGSIAKAKDIKIERLTTGE